MKHFTTVAEVERTRGPLAAIARIEEIHPNAVRHRLRVAGVALRPPGRQAAFALGGRDSAR